MFTVVPPEGEESSQKGKGAPPELIADIDAAKEAAAAVKLELKTVRQLMDSMSDSECEIELHPWISLLKIWLFSKLSDILLNA